MFVKTIAMPESPAVETFTLCALQPQRRDNVVTSLCSFVGGDYCRAVLHMCASAVPTLSVPVSSFFIYGVRE